MELDPWVIWQSAGFLAHGLLLSALLVAVGAAGGALLGGVLAAARATVWPVALLAAAYVTVMRSVPLVLVLFWFYFMLPVWTGSPVGALPAALIAFVLFEAAFYCEIIRAGVAAVPAGSPPRRRRPGCGRGRRCAGWCCRRRWPRWARCWSTRW